MKSRQLTIAVMILTVFALLINISSCTHEDVDDSTTTTPDESQILVAKKITTPPSIDGDIDAIWATVDRITVEAVVPEVGNDVFRGYVGDKYTVNLKAAYDNSNIYFLCEWNDVNEDLSRQTWYFNAATSLWAQESRVPVFDEFGSMIRKPFYEDKFAFLWNVNNTVADWKASTCYASCHTGMNPDDGLARHYTLMNERIDMWHWKMVRTNVNGQADDQFQNDTYPNGRHGDVKVSGGYSNNVQTLNNGSADVSVPKYFVPGASYYYWITQNEIDAGTAKLITAVDEDGVLTYNGGTIDPNVDTDFQRDGGEAGAKGMPSVYTTAFVGSRGDLNCFGKHTGSGWVLEWKRALMTGDMDGEDVDFSTLEEQPFGIGVFDNAGIAHAIKPGLLLRFE